jgi:hypothetical protein
LEGERSWECDLMDIVMIVDVCIIKCDALTDHEYAMHHETICRIAFYALRVSGLRSLIGCSRSRARSLGDTFLLQSPKLRYRQPDFL